jgi:hypothetical protein
MNPLRTFCSMLLALGSASASLASPPTQVGDSFFFFANSFPSTLSSGPSGVIYLARDGTCELLSAATASRSPIDGSVTTAYGASQSGTYTYVSTPGNPAVATLSINLADGSALLPPSMTLGFADDTSGYSVEFPLVHFAFMLAAPNTFLTNVSNRANLRSSDSAISGFVVEGSLPRLVVIRTVGPSLAQFGVSPFSANPQLSLFSGTGSNLIASAQKWSSITGLDAQAAGWIFAIAGAFPLLANSNDVAIVGVLNPGVYTAHSGDSTVGSSGSSSLTEVYILPYSGNVSSQFSLQLQ